MAILFALSLIGLFALSVLTRSRPTESYPASAGEVAALTTLPPPPEATHMHVASCNPGIAPDFQGLVRFEAPPDVCLRYAAALLHRPASDDAPRFDRELLLDAMGDTRWFDLDRATNVVGGQSPNPRTLNVWVDRDRGVFYLETH